MLDASHAVKLCQILLESTTAAVALKYSRNSISITIIHVASNQIQLSAS